MTVGVINYGMGNIASVCNTLARLGASPVVLDKPGDIDHVDHFVVVLCELFYYGAEPGGEDCEAAC